MNATHTPAQPALAGAALWITGTVAHRDGDVLYVSVEHEGRAREARRAFGCLVTPEVGDVVCVLCDERGQHHVTTVLHRPDASEATLGVPGRLAIEAPAGLTVRTGQGIELHAERLDGHVTEARWWSRLVQITGKELLVRTGLARLASEVAELMTQRVQINAERSYRHVTEAEHVRAGVLDMKAEQVVHIRARHTIVTAQQLTKLDGSQVHVG